MLNCELLIFRHFVYISVRYQANSRLKQLFRRVVAEAEGLKFIVSLNVVSNLRFRTTLTDDYPKY